MENKKFIDKRDWYYNLVKPWISLIPEGHHKVLDLGCGTGQFGLQLKKTKKASEIVGVEIYKEAAEEAAKFYDRVFIGDIELLNIDYEEYFDFVICNDIIEHLRDPWAALRKMDKWIKKGGYILASIPNIRHWVILRDLIFFGNWDYVEAGILDNTHLRFFTRKSVNKMLLDIKYEIEYERIEINGVIKKFVNSITLNLFEEFLGTHIIVLAKKQFT